MSKRIISLEIPIELKIKLETEAKARELSTSGLIRLILKQYYAEKDK